jgi:2,5-furandicarboxylate decarboxylase 1
MTRGNREPVTTLRDWLALLESTGRVARAKPGVPLQHTLAAIAKRLDGEKATIFPAPDGRERRLGPGFGP